MSATDVCLCLRLTCVGVCVQHVLVPRVSGDYGSQPPAAGQPAQQQQQVAIIAQPQVSQAGRHGETG